VAKGENLARVYRLSLDSLRYICSDKQLERANQKVEGTRQNSALFAARTSRKRRPPSLAETRRSKSFEKGSCGSRGHRDCSCVTVMNSSKHGIASIKSPQADQFLQRKCFCAFSGLLHLQQGSMQKPGFWAVFPLMPRIFGCDAVRHPEMEIGNSSKICACAYYG
jgi:hypothetical protein